MTGAVEYVFVVTLEGGVDSECHTRIEAPRRCESVAVAKFQLVLLMLKSCS